jgi:hypothetical protein
MTEERQIRIGPPFYVLFAMFTLLLFPVHEFGHYITYRLLSVHLQVTLNTACPDDQSLRRPLAELVGVFAIPFLLVVWCIARTFRANRFQTLLHILSEDGRSGMGRSSIGMINPHGCGRLAAAQSEDFAFPTCPGNTVRVCESE